jgi:hypothetical protein
VVRIAGALTLVVLVLAGCGSAASYDNTPRPAAPINVSVSLTDRGVRVSPARVGAGPAVLLIANESARSRDVVLAAPAGAGRACVSERVSSGVIYPQGTARVSVALVRGTCTVGVRDGGAHAARLTVGHERPSAQSDLLQP